MRLLSRKLVILMTVFEILALILFALFVRFDQAALPTSHAASIEGVTYSMFQDIHVMIFIGFGFLMTFLNKYSYSSVGFNLLLAAFVIQWSTLTLGFCHAWDHFTHINIDMTRLLGADICAAAILISFGAVLGKTSPLQLFVMAFFEVIFYSVNETLCFQYLKISDMGGSIVVHAFGAYFGLAVAFVLYREEAVGHANEGSSYQSDLSAMIGTVFLWIFWPSFNAGLATGDQQQRAVFNTYFALAACTCASFVVSSLLDREGRYRMVHIQNSTLAGGVAVGASANMLLPIWLSMLTGIIAGVISVIGYDYITPFLSKRRIHDTCGVNNLHGMPALIAAVLSAIIAASAHFSQYGNSLYSIFPGRTPTNLTIPIPSGAVDMPNEPLSAAGQSAMQAAGIGVTLGISIVSGLITGYIMKFSIFDEVKHQELYLDSPHWEVADSDAATAEDRMRGTIKSVEITV